MNIELASASTLNKNFCKRDIIITKEPQPHLTKNLRYLLGEIAMYRADRFFGFNMVPTTSMIRKKNNENQDVICCCSQWIESAHIPIAHSGHLKSLISEQEWAQMNIFYFLFGQYDRHFGNLIIEKGTGKLYLIDNEAVANVQQHVAAYSPEKLLCCPWVGNVGDFIAKEQTPTTEPENFSTVIAIKQDPALLHKNFPEVDIWTQFDIDRGNCRLWHNSLWRQFYITENIAAPFCDVISPELLQKLVLLTRRTLESLWPELPCELTPEGNREYKNLIDQFVIKTLERRDMILAYFKNNPTGVRPYKK